MYCFQTAAIEAHCREQDIRREIAWLRRLRICLKQRKRSYRPK